MKAVTNNYSIQQFHLMQYEIENIKEALKHRDLVVIDLILMEEREVLQFLKVTRNTLLNYRKKYGIAVYNIFGRNYYLKHEIYEAILNQILKP